MSVLKDWVADDAERVALVADALGVGKRSAEWLINGERPFLHKHARKLYMLTGHTVSELMNEPRKTPLQEWVYSELGRVGEIAKYLGVTQVYASNLVTGKHRMTLPVTKKLMELTGLSASDLNPELAELV